MKAKVVGFLIGIAVVVGAAMLIKGGTYVGQRRSWSCLLYERWCTGRNIVSGIPSGISF